MAEIYLKSAENTLILEPRESVKRPFDFGAWTEMRMGVFFSGIASVGDNTNAAAETVVLVSNLDYLTFGIKDTSAYLPGSTGSLFLGAVTPVNATSAGVYSGLYLSSSSGIANLAACGSYDATFVLGTSASMIDCPQCPNTISGTTAYCGFYAVKFVISNIGAATQSVAISSAYANSVAGSDYSIAALRTAINNATYGAAKTVAWNTGAVASAIPTCAWIRLPFYNNRIRISSICLIKIA